MKVQIREDILTNIKHVAVTCRLRCFKCPLQRLSDDDRRTTLPSPDYLTDDVQYFPAGPENKLANQIEASKKQAAEKQKLQQGF